MSKSMSSFSLARSPLKQRCSAEIVWVVWLWIFVSCSAAFSQSATGTILGTLKDPSGAVVPGVKVTVVNQGTNLSRSVSTSESGDYTIPLLPLGTYEIRAERNGFKTSVVSGIVLRVDQLARVEMDLEIGEASQEVSVSGESPLVQTDSGSIGQVIESRQIIALPLNGRNFMQLTLLAPGFVNTRGDSLRQSYQGISPSANGTRAENNNYTLDGTSNTEHWTGNVTSVPPLDSLQEFKLQTANYSAEYGQGGAAVINIATKSGTNQYHGSLWQFHRNDNLDARNFFAPVKPEFKRNQFGGTLGGPVIKDKTFFFGSYEGIRQRKGLTITRLIPTPEELNGDFSRSTGAAPRDPLTGQPFPGRIIPPNRIDPTSKKIAESFFPRPNNSDPIRNYIVSPSEESDTDNYSVRIDHRLSSKGTLFGRYNDNGASGLTPGGWVGCCDREIDTAGRQAGLGYSHVFAPNVVNEFKFGANWVRKTGRDSSFGTDIPAQLGLTGIPSDDYAKTFIFLSVTGYGVPSVNVSSDVALDTFAWSDNLSYTRGSHSFKMGVEFSQYRFNDFTAPNVPLNMQFGGTFSGNGLADFLLARARSLGISFRQPRFEIAFNTAEAYVQDDWKAASNLTLNYGLRFTTQSPTTEADDEYVGFNTQTGALMIPRTANLPLFLGKVELIDRRTLFDRDIKFAPRFGFAYRPFASDRLVVRGGYGIFTVLEIANTHRQPATNAPFRLIYGATDNTTGFGWNDGRPTPEQVAAGFASGFTLQIINPEWANGYLQNWNLTLEQKLASETVFSVGYVGTKGTHLSENMGGFNNPPPGLGAIQARRPYPNYAGITLLHNPSNSVYHALQTRLERRYSTGLTLLSSYTYGKALGDSSTLNGNFTQDPRCRACEKGRLLFDVRQRFVNSFSYELPWGPGRKFWNGSGALTNILGGWVVSGIMTFQTGFPLTVTTIDNANTGGQNRANLVAGANPNPKDRTIDAWIPRSAFAQNPAFTYGTSGKGIVDSPGINQIDLSLIKEFRIREGSKLEFRVDFFNAFNHPNFGNPNTNFNSGAFGTISSAEEPRDIQVGLRFSF
ncbi:MAG: carboxypeptidase regulatory-like domain-containing protein [Acidobacteria bacterium]|nr:carboxypeptidase regulatory-like domain-containing protein [Acidobacteriota bacterium]MCI0723388.1 carboxypeptidase regulatory-like domain-containing protein [Acidobacteriota bacterium]